MILLDTDTLSLLFRGQPRVEARVRSAQSDVTTTVVTWIEVLQGRFDALLKAANADQLERAYRRLHDSVQQLARLTIVAIGRPAAEQFEKLLRSKKLKKIGRGDLFIASIALAEQATLASRNLRDFKQIPGLKVENWAD
jgi:tRNA(fMet)-specific endonuclease VapC